MKCIICGSSEDGKTKLFCFPKDAARCRLWQEFLGMTYRGGLKNYRICSSHFSSESFIPAMAVLKLKKNAVPISILASQVQSLVSSLEDIIPDSQTEAVASTSAFIPICAETVQGADMSEVQLSVQPSSSLAIQSPLTVPVSCPFRPVRRSLFKEVGLSFDNVTPRKKALMHIVRRKENHLRKLKKLCRTRGKQLRFSADIETTPQFSGIFKGMSATTAQFLVSQIRCSKRSPYGRRWTADEKVMALAIYKKSLKCYSLLRRLLSLPSKRTLTKLLERIPFNVGINTHIFKHLGECLAKYPEHERACTLAFDEMSLREHLHYNSKNDCFEGVEDFGTERTNEIANYALVFMAQGIVKPWKQPLAFYFSRGGVDSNRLESILKEVLSALRVQSIPVLGTVCDMGTANVKTLKNMGATESNASFASEGRTIATIFDVPHLLKSTRNLFKKYNILIPTSDVLPSCDIEQLQARWSDIAASYEYDKNTPLIFRSLYKLKDYYMAPLRQNAMKVQVAAQTMSRSTAVCIYNLVTRGILPSRALATAKFISDVDEIFDSCNGSVMKAPEGKPYKCAVTKETEHIQFWKKSLESIKQWRFLRNPTDMNSKYFWKPPTQNGWLYTLQAFPLIWKELQSLGAESFKPRYLNQDSLENLFGAIRSGCGCNENPTVTQFIGSLKTQVINGLTNQSLKGTNCEEDELVILSNLRSFLNVSEEPTTCVPVSTDSTPIQIATDVASLVASGSVESMSVAYVAGFMVKRIFKKHSCDVCKAVMMSDDLEPFNQFIAAREFSDDNKKLFYPSEQLVVVVGKCITIMEEQLKASKKDMNLMKKVYNNVAYLDDFNFLNKCGQHCHFLKTCIIESLCRIGLPWFCSRLCRDIRNLASRQATERKQKKLAHV